ncbi:sugar kinase [Rubrivirga sp. S365]|uniref:Sugar kinase n=1 Tax=Rubrivirga litoralis TaxID=3075598 RepID=A0ABU3BNP5_9BACT|nr:MULTISPECIES: sugar kinase [unclassified Rubrivirga]MDT0630898.1 sugar kinase [Rubrivirga sp. F394]MDT7856541.1 sugar kinase [Rubrivirga sp. S365]
MSTVVTFGEIMLRLSTPGFTRITQAQRFDATYGGGEANVAVSLAHFGHDARFVCKLPEHEVGQAAVNQLRRFGVDTRFVVRGGDRVGIYFLETGASQRPSKVVYDRAHSAVSEMDPDEVDWDAAFDGADWFHWTGITPALGAKPKAAVERACRAAKAAGATVSCDLNFRSKLWTTDEAQATMRPLMEHVDVCIANEEDADRSLGVTTEGSGAEAAEDAELDEAGYAQLAEKLKADFGFDAVAITLRESISASDNGWSAMLLGGAGRAAPLAEAKRSRRYDLRLVDRVGGGDSFAAGLVHGLLTKTDAEEALNFAVAASALKQTIPGDLNLSTAAEVEALAGGAGSGRVQR